MEPQDSPGLTLNPERFRASGADVLHSADAVVSSWEDIQQAIAPVIGARGVAALYERSLHLTRTQHPWMVAVSEPTKLEMNLAALKTLLLQQDGATAAAGGTAHMQKFYEVLSTLIGPSLSDGLLRFIWEKSTNGPTTLDKTSI